MSRQTQEMNAETRIREVAERIMRLREDRRKRQNSPCRDPRNGQGDLSEVR